VSAARTGLVALLLGGFVGAGCDLSRTPVLNDKQVRGGDAARGRAIVAGGAYGCTACHAIPGMPGPQGSVGPPLDGMAGRALIAGQLPNKPEVLVAFLRNPPSLVPATGMPDVRLGLDEARDIAAYLYTLEPSRAP
jgi:cytochrome c2